MVVRFGDLPPEGRDMLTRHLQIDFSRCSLRAPDWFSAWALNEGGHLIAIFAVEFPSWFEGKVNILVLDPRAVTRRALRAIFTALFSKVRRLTAEVEPDNLRARRQVEAMGFRTEGYRRLGVEGSRDTVLYGMLREDCRFLPGYRPPSGVMSLSAPPRAAQSVRMH